MIIRIDADHALPVYEQIREQIMRMVLAGTLAEGTRLPTIRQLANDLQLAKGTVAKAYALLEASSVVESRGHKGTFILPHAKTSTADPAVIAAAATAYAVSARQAGLDFGQAIEALKKSWIPTQHLG